MNFLPALSSGVDVSARLLRVLCFCAIIGLDVWVWLVLGFCGGRVFELSESFFDIAGH